MEKIKPHSRSIRLLFFWIGIIATLAYRSIIVLNFYDSLWVKIAWYIGTIGFTIYFWHRYNIQERRSKLVEDYKLVDLVKKSSYADKKRKEALVYVVETSFSSRAKWNSAFICWLSVLALILGIIMDIR